MAQENTLSAEDRRGNPLGTAPVWPQLFRFGIPAMISLLVGAIYNITDQVFIGQIVGMYGNAATNVAMPLVTLVQAIATLIAFGSSANFTLSIGADNKKDGARFAGNAVSLSVISGLAIMAIALVFLHPLVQAFGATTNTAPLAATYIQITAIGFPFLLFATACTDLIRSDGSPTFAMIASITGAVINVGLDALFMFAFGWGIAGAAWATVIGQIASAGFMVFYFTRFKTVKLTKADIKPRREIVLPIAKYGVPGFFGSFTSMAVQITLNNMMRYYGGLSVYGSDIPLAVMAVVSRISIVVYAINAGFSIGSNPLIGYNLGAQNNRRVREIFLKTALAIAISSVIFTAVFQMFPQQIVSIFGSGTPAYFEFAVKYIRIFIFLMPISGLASLCSFFITTTGKSLQGLILSVSRQGIPLIILALVLPRVFDIDGILWAGPIGDGIAMLLAAIFIVPVLRGMSENAPQITGDILLER